MNIYHFVDILSFPNIVYVVDVDDLTLSVKNLLITDDGVDGKVFNSKLAGVTVSLISECSITLQEFKERQEWKDATIWTIAIDKSDHIKGFINRYAETLSARRDKGVFSWLSNTHYPIDIIVPHKNITSFKDCCICCYAKVYSNLPVLDKQGDNDVIKRTRSQHLPDLKIEGSDYITANGVETFTIIATYNDKVADFTLDVELSTINGYLPKTRLDVSGSSTFKVHALGLESGDTIRIKAGFRYYASVTEKIIQVV